MAPTGFYGTCDASHNVTWNSRGLTGWAYQLCGEAISWHCRAQSTVALSSTEAELIACDSALRELQYLYKMLREFGQQVDQKVRNLLLWVDIEPTLLAQDNISTITLCNGTDTLQRANKAYRAEVPSRWTPTGSRRGQASVLTADVLKTGEMTADVLTKPLGTAAFQKHRAVLLCSVALQWQALRRRGSAKRALSPPVSENSKDRHNHNNAS
jgi:hypothetical protein